MKNFLHYLYVIMHIFVTTRNIRVLIYVLNVCFLWLLWKKWDFFQKKYIKKASKFRDLIVNTNHGEYLCSNFHDFLEVHDNYELETNDIIKKITKDVRNTKDKYLINVWCNVWRWAIACAKVYWYNVIAFEPAPETYRRLKINILLSNLDNKIETYNIWLWDRNETIKFEYVPEWNGGSHVIQSDTKTGWNIIEIPIKKFDDLWIDKEKIEKTKLVIMDVEWFELNVLKWMENTLKEFKDVKLIIEIHDTNKNRNETMNFMADLWFSAEKIDNLNYLFSK